MIHPLDDGQADKQRFEAALNVCGLILIVPFWYIDLLRQTAFIVKHMAAW